MFDIGFWELVFISIVALLVVGPNKLPELARTLGLWVGQAQRFINQMKADIDQEIRASELKQTLHDSTHLPEIDDIKDTVNEAQKALDVSQLIDDYEEINSNDSGHSDYEPLISENDSVDTYKALDASELIDDYEKIDSNDSGHTDYEPLMPEDDIADDEKTK